MLKPRGAVGCEYAVRAITNKGTIQRLISAFDSYDARAQILDYCWANGLIPVRVIVHEAA